MMLTSIYTYTITILARKKIEILKLVGVFVALNFTLEWQVIFVHINFENGFSVSLGLFIRTFTNYIIFYLWSIMSQLSPLLLLQNHYTPLHVCMAMRYVTYAHGLCLVDPDNNLVWAIFNTVYTMIWWGKMWLPSTALKQLCMML